MVVDPQFPLRRLAQFAFVITSVHLAHPNGHNKKCDDENLQGVERVGVGGVRVRVRVTSA